MKSPANVPNEAAKDIKEALMKPGQNYGKDRYTIDLIGTEATYWVGTESGLSIGSLSIRWSMYS